MAFRNMMEGDCGSQNPLMKLGSHFTQDQAFRQDRGVGISTPFPPSEQFANEFCEQQYGSNLQNFRVDNLADEIRKMDLQATRAPINQAPNVAQLTFQESSKIWSEEFVGMDKLGAARPDVDQPHSLSISPFPGEVFSANPGPINFERAVTNPRAHIGIWQADFETQQKGELWSETFLSDSHDNNITYDVPSESESKFQKFWQQAEDKSELKETITEGYGLQDIDTQGDFDTDDFWEKMQKAWQDMANSDNDSLPWENEFTTHVDPFNTYEFEANNPMEKLQDPFEEGLKKLDQQDLPSAVLCFEAAVKANKDNALAWQYLGTTQAANEQDPAAIAAFRSCLALQPANLIVLMSLAISYTNENYHNQACQMLREWLLNNPKYKHLCERTSAPNRVSSLLDKNYHGQVRDLFIEAAKLSPTGKIDVDVQCGLGVLFNLSNEHDKAVDCFRAALSESPSDFRMWNRLGATLANGNRSEEAVAAYSNALQLSPGFIRARYNLGICCINLNSHRQAVEHFLTALNLQANGTTSRGDKGSMSDCIWSTLRLVISILGNTEILPLVESRDLAALSKEYSVK